MTNATATEDAAAERPVSLLEFKNFVRERARQGRVWSRLESELSETTGLANTIVSRRSELDEVGKQIEKARAEVAASKDEAKRILAAARDEAAGILSEADRTTERADARLRESDEVLKTAKANAEAIVSAARVESKKLLQVFDELRGKVAP